MQEFAGRIAVVTGGASGMGRELVRQLAAQGAHVAMCDLSVEEMEETRRLAARYPFLDMAQCARLLRTYGTKAQDVLGDARQPADLGESFDGGLTSREVAYLREREWARTSEDILWRRTKLGLFLTPGQRAGLEALLDPDAAVFGRDLGEVDAVVQHLARIG